MNAEIMTINPNELVIDLPVDDAHVQELMESLQKNGRMFEPVTVWLQGMRIVNGFHRTEAAKRLGWESMPCLVQDSTEDEFWDARIIAAKPHKEVEPKRLAAWMLESWRQEFGDKAISVEDVKEAYRKFGIEFEQESISNETLQVLTIIDTFRMEYNSLPREVKVGTETVELYRTKKGKVTYGERPIWHKRDSTAIESWFETKAAKWGVSVSGIETMLLSAVGLNEVLIKKILIAGRNSRRPIAEMFAIVNQVNKDIYVSPYGNSWNFDTSWIEAVDSGEFAGVPYVDYVIQKEQEKENSEREQQEQFMREVLAQNEAARLRREQYEQTPQGKAERERQIIDGCRSDMTKKLAFAVSEIRTIPANFIMVPEAPAMLAEFAQFVADFSAEHFPDVQVAQPNPVALENSRLRAENAKLKERIASLERALGSKQAAGEMLSSAMAWSSGDLER